MLTRTTAPPPAKLLSLRVIGALILREMTTTYGRSPGGYLWSVLEPAAGITLLTIAFSIGFHAPPLGDSFALFYAAGLLPLTLYMDVSSKMAQTIPFNRALLTYPRITFLDALIARLMLNVLTQLLVHFVVLGFILLVLSPVTTFDFVKIVQAYLLTLALAIGVGTLNSYLFVAFPVWQATWAILNRPLFLISCVFFIYESIPGPYDQWLWFNPLVHIAGLMRDGFYSFYQPDYVSILYPLILSAGATVAGLFLLNRYHRDILEA